MTGTKTFRIFISSTFSDFQLERQVLHEKVFPEIDKYCVKHGYQFQPVDLRWGVNDEAQLDQKTLELCLNEVRACKHFPYPNFLIMLGNRYGWVPLPYAIEKSEFEAILDFYINDSTALALLKEWYIEDANYLIDISYAYILKARDPKGVYARGEDWEKVENQLRILLQNSANQLFKETPQYVKYFLSATEAEVQEGIFKYLQPTEFQLELQKEHNEIFEIDKDYVYGFIRNINESEKADLTNEPAKSFIDKDQTNIAHFKKELVKNTFVESNLLQVDVTLGGSDKENPFKDKSYLLDFEKFMVDKLKNAIDQQIKEAQDISLLAQEQTEQLRFKSLKIETFFGREKELEKIEEYIQSKSTQPFIVHGVSGIGKSSFIAKVIDNAEEAMTHAIFYRFIGASASSSNIRTLLESILQELASQNILKLPDMLKKENDQFYQQVKDLLMAIEQPTIIVLDALDQLQNKDYLQWLPLELPSNLKIILSMLDQKGHEHYYDLLKNKIQKENQLHIQPLGENAAVATLQSLLKKEKRTLSEDQFSYTIEQFKKSNGSPLYLKIAFEEVKTWKSTDVQEELREGVQEIIKEFIDNLTKKHHHSLKIVHKTLGLLYASKNGLSEKEILDILSRDERILNDLEKYHKLDLMIDGEKVRRFPISAWARLHEQLKPFLVERSIDNQNLISFFHRQIDEAVHDYIYKSSAESLHTELADYFLTLQDQTKLWDKRYYNPHMLDETPYQLFKAKDTKRLKEILFDLEFAGAIYDNAKQEGFKEILEKATELDGIAHDEIYPWESFFREKEHLITLIDEQMWQPHKSLFQLAYEDGENSALSQKAQWCLENNKIDFLWLQRKNRPKDFKRTGLLKVLKGHTNTVNGAKILEDGRILSWSHDNTLRLWDSNGQPLAVLEGHTNTVNGAKILEDGRILSWSYDDTLRLWDSNGQPLAVLEGHTNTVNGAKILEDGRILSWSDDDTLRLWNSEGKPLVVLEGHTLSVNGVEILQDGKILSYSYDGLKFWSSEGKLFTVSNAKPLVALEDSDLVGGVKILQDGKILSYSFEGTLQLWNSKGESLALLKGHTAFVNGVEISENGNILSYSEDNTLRLWNSKGEPLAILEGHTSSVDGVKILKDGRILSYSKDKTLRLWSSDGEPLAILNGHTYPVNGVEILKDGRILSYSNDWTLRLWNIEAKPLVVLDRNADSVKCVKILSNGRFFSNSYLDDNLRFWGSNGELLAVLDGYTNSIENIKVSENGNILSYSNDNTLRLWRSDGQLLAVLEGHTDSVNGVEISENGNILSYSKDNTLRLWSSEGKPLAVLEGHTDSVNGVEISENGNILSYSKDNTLRLWSSEGKPLAVLEGHTNSIRGAKISKGEIILSSSWDGTVRVWSSEGKPLANSKGTGYEILNDGRILTYYEDDNLYLWNYKSGLLTTLREHDAPVDGVKILEDGKILSHSKDSVSILWSSEGKLLAILGKGMLSGNIKILKDGRILFCSLRSLQILNSDGKSLAVLEGHADYVEGFKILENGKILSYSKDKTLRLWSSEGKKLSLLSLPTEEIQFEDIQSTQLIATSDKSLLVYSFYNGDKNITIDEVANKLENLLYKDGI